MIETYIKLASWAWLILSAVGLVLGPLLIGKKRNDQSETYDYAWWLGNFVKLIIGLPLILRLLGFI